MLAEWKRFGKPAITSTCLRLRPGVPTRNTWLRQLRRPLPRQSWSMSKERPKERIDKLLVERGLADSRARAQALVLAGQVLAGEQRIDKPGQVIDSSAEIRIKGETPRYVGRGGFKLE